MVDKNVLIPRPETEVIIDYVLNKCGENGRQIFDVGTGSGCIAITLALELKKKNVGADIVASDVSGAALNVAEINYKEMIQRENGADEIRAKCGIKFLKSDLLSNLKIETDRPTIVAANLPYVSQSWDWVNKKQLSFEPEDALFAEQNGLALIFELIEQFAEKFKSSNKAILILESDESQQQAIVEYAKKFNLKSEKISEFVLALEF